MSNLGFIGLGIMGRPMAGHLQAAGNKLFLHTRSKLPQEHLDKGAVACRVKSGHRSRLTCAPARIQAPTLGPQSPA